MSLPKAIQRQVDEAAAAEALIANSQAKQGEFVVTDPSQLPASQQPLEAAPAPAQPAAPAAPAEDWQQKYRSLQGMFAQQTGELRAQVKAYESRFTDLQAQLEAVSAAQKQTAKDKAQADPSDVENFGADMVDMVKRYSEQVFQSLADQFGSKLAAVEGRLNAVEEKVTGVSDRTAVTLEQQFYAALEGLVPDWQEINKDQRWLNWLAEVDPVYGADRQAALDQAHQAMDAKRVASVFNAFKAAQPAKAKASLADQVAPSATYAQAPAQAPGQTKQLFAEKFVAKFYQDLTKGVYAKNPAEAARIEAEINQAAAEGRIVPAGGAYA
jgi:hypothetical protein